MARSMSKQKGSAYERKVCKRLSLWVSGGRREDLFWRSAMSGGRATVGRKKGKLHADHAGDITATSPAGHVLTDRWYVECKAIRDLKITSALLKGEGLLARYWREAVKEATAHNKMPMLIAKQNNAPEMMIIPSPHLLSPTGVNMFEKARLGSFALLRCQAFDLVKVLELPFQVEPSHTAYPFLGPGELKRILGLKGKSIGVLKPKIKRERL